MGVINIQGSQSPDYKPWIASYGKLVEEYFEIHNRPPATRRIIEMGE
jgi:hypothetical protein